MKRIVNSERANLFEPNVYIYLLVKIKGNPQLDDLVSAVKTAFSTNEATMSKIAMQKSDAVFYEMMDESGCHVSVSRKSWKELIYENEKIPFAINKGELMRVFVIPGEGEIFLLLMAHHLVGDGKSIVYFLEDVMKAISGENQNYKPLSMINSDSFPQEAKLSFYMKQFVKKFNKKWKNTNDRFDWTDYYEIHETYWKKRKSKIMYQTFSPAEMKRISLKAKEIGVTVNSYIASVFLRANPVNRSIGFAVDARLDQNRSMSNQATGITIKHIYSEKKSFEENTQLAHEKIQRKLRNPARKFFILLFMPLIDPTLMDSVLLHTYDLYQNKTTQKLAKVLGYKGKETRSLGISNLARLDIPSQYGAYEIADVLFIPPVVSYSKHIIGISTIDDNLSISYHFMDDQDEEEERNFFDRAIQFL